jgi:hypothetical protein
LHWIEGVVDRMCPLRSSKPRSHFGIPCRVCFPMKSWSLIAKDWSLEVECPHRGW